MYNENIGQAKQDAERTGTPLPAWARADDTSKTIFSLEQVNQLADENPGFVIVTHGDGVYNVTSFVQYHPGAHYLLLANGGPLEPWWNLYKVHGSGAVQNMLEQFRIGTLREADRVAYDELGDPFEYEPSRHPGLHVYTPLPLDAATNKHTLLNTWYTPADQFYVRNHFPVPELDAEDHEVTVSLPGVCEL